MPGKHLDFPSETDKPTQLTTNLGICLGRIEAERDI